MKEFIKCLGVGLGVVFVAALFFILFLAFTWVKVFTGISVGVFVLWFVGFLIVDTYNTRHQRD